MEQFLQNYLGICIMVAGGLVALIGILLLVNHGTPAKVIIGVVLGALGLGAVGVGYTLDQSIEVNYTVSGIMKLSDRGDGTDEYRVTLKDEKGTSTWIYLNDSTIAAFPEGKEVTMTKRQVKMYRDEKRDSQ
jgi:hypothetical protein